MDMNGDGKIDLIVTAVGNGSYQECFGADSTPFWKVYLNTGQDFDTTFTKWIVPAGGGAPGYNGRLTFNYIVGGSAAASGANVWTLYDMDGDKKPDLVVTAIADSTFNHDQWTFGAGQSRYWKVYKNTGNSFSANAINWTLPSGGYTYHNKNFGFTSLGSPSSSLGVNTGSEDFATMDMNGDNLPDLVITATCDSLHMNSFGNPANQYWKVHLNNGTGFDTASYNYALPVGGTITNGHLCGFNLTTNIGTADTGSLGWKVFDITGDKLPDLAVVCRGDGNYIKCMGADSIQYWLVYKGTPNGFFPDSIKWQLPAGGKMYGSAWWGYYATSYSPSQVNNSPNCNAWNTVDINADNKPDLIVTAKHDGNNLYVLGGDTTPHWNIYLNIDTGFASYPQNWYLPSGGHKQFGFLYTGFASSPLSNEQGWNLFDINGDKGIDLVVFAEGNNSYCEEFGMPSSPYWRVYLNQNVVTGIKTINVTNQIAVYPNPTSTLLNIDLRSQSNTVKITSVRLYNVLGACVKTVSTDNNTTTFDVSIFTPGMYIGQVIGNNGDVTGTFRFIKN